jgi:hypothetical protein
MFALNALRLIRIYCCIYRRKFVACSIFNSYNNCCYTHDEQADNDCILDDFAAVFIKTEIFQCVDDVHVYHLI